MPADMSSPLAHLLTGPLAVWLHTMYEFRYSSLSGGAPLQASSAMLYSDAMNLDTMWLVSRLL